MGLSAEQVGSAERLYGFNELASNPGPPMWRLVLKQFDDLMVKILLTAAALDLLIAWGNGEGLGSLVEPGVILLILAANATVGVVTETNAAQAIEALKALEAEHALVLRGGAWRTLPARQVVPGDVVEVSPGSKVPADVRVVRLDGPQLRVDQSILTGESGSVRKDAEALRRAQAVVQDRTNILFGGTVVTAGRAACVVVATGSRSAMGAIRDAVAAQAEGETPLQKRLDELGVVLAKIITVICVAVWLLSLPHFSDPAHGSWLAGGLYYFKVAVALAVAAIPEGLPAVVTTCLALGTRAMAQRGAIVRRLPSVETLGCTTVICCDKTGTLTSNQMAVSHVVVLESAGGGILGEVPTDPPADPPRDVSHSVWSWRGSFSRGASAGEGAADASPDEPVAGVRAASAPPLPLAPLSLAVTGSSYDPQGWIYRARGAPGARLQPERVERPAQAMRTLRMLGLVSAQCNDARLEMGPQGKLERTGEATEVALRVFCEKLGLPQGLAVAEQSSAGAGTPANAGWAEACPRVGGLEFSRERRCMSSLVEVLGGASGLRGRLLLCKGSPESILERCRFCAFEQGSDQAPPGPNSTLTSELADFLPSVCPLDPAQRALLLSQATSLGARGALRMLGVAFRVWKESPRELEPEDENDLVFVGLLGIHDPPRPDVAAALRLCARAGIRVIMVTGDNAATAQAVGAQVGLLPAATQAAAKSSPLQNDAFERATPPLSPPLSHMPSPFVHLALQEAQSGLEGEGGKSRAVPGLPLFSSVHPLPSFLEEASSILSSESLPAPSSSRPVRALTGLDFDSLDDHGQARAARRMAVFSRVEARHKSRLVELLRAQGEVVAMTGDGVNDAPALRAADIGVAMGSGTAVAREAADMVLADDRFSTIVAAVGAGRTIFANTQQFVRYMISSNIGEVVAILTCTLLGLPECLAPVQLLWVNLVTDGLPATALGFNPPDPLVMSRPPRRASQAVVGPRALMRYALVGAYVGAVTVAGFVHAFTAAPDGPGLRFSQLRNFEHCVRDSDAGARPASIPCDVFETRLPSTVAMTVLVVVEMFNALNALSEEASLLQLPPWANPWLLAAIALTLALHCCVLYLPPLAAVFGTAALSWADWQAVLALSAPVLLLDEALKLWAPPQAAGGVEDRVDAALRGARLATRGRWARARRAALRWWEGRRGKISAASAMALRADAV